MVPRAEFERVRRLLQEALDKAYADYLVKPEELWPGYWVMWPHRRVELTLEEARYWLYGEPGEGTGRLQIDVHWPYGNHDKIRQKGDNPLTEKAVARAAKTAESMSKLQAEHYGLLRKAEEAYLFAYNVIAAMTEEKRERYWEVRAKTYELKAPWGPLHDTVYRIFQDSRQANPEEWDRLFAGAAREKSPREWGPRERAYSDKMYDTFFNAALAAIDDWALETGHRKRDVQEAEAE